MLPISVIIPTYDRPHRLAACLAALAASDYPPEQLEVIVVDDGSPQPLDTVVAPLAGALPVRLIRQPNAGPAAARNRGAAHAQHPFLAFTDDDCRPRPDWLRALDRAARRQPGALLAGRTLNALPENPYAAASQQLIDYLYEYFHPATGRVPLVASNNLALPRPAFQTLGGFDERFPLAAGEDRDLCARWHAAGHPVAHVDDAVVLHAHSLTARSFWRQHCNYGRGAFHYHRLRPDRELTPESLRFYWDLVAFPLRHERTPGAATRSALLALSQLANVAGYAHEARLARRACSTDPGDVLV